jgi:hypothetical protein
VHPARSKRKPVAVTALAIAGLLVAAGIAWASADGNVSHVRFQFSPSTVPKTTYKSGALSVHVDTVFKNPGNNPLGGWTHRVQLWFDNDFRFNTGSAPRCNKNLANTTEKQAMALCGNALVGKGTAFATSGTGAHIPGCVIVFNGAKNSLGQPTLILHTRFVMQPGTCTNPATNTGGSVDAILAGVLKPANKTGYGKMLDVNNIDHNPLPLEAFDAKIQKGSYVQARCSHSTRTWHVIGKHTYSDGQSNTATVSQKCTPG